jgi:hypothetical protein
LAAVTAVATFAPAFVRADPPAAPVSTAAGDFQPYVGEVTGDDVYVRSGPTEGFYATSKLNKGDRVTVVGVRGVDSDNYLKIVPPDGSFCYVAKSYVELVPGSTSAGKVTRSDLIVRAGSTLNNKMNTMLMKLDAGDAVQLLGTQDDGKYFKIAPPPGAYLYVKKSFVSPVANAGPVSVPLTAQANDREPIATDPPAPATPAKVAVATPPAPVEPPPVAVAPAAPVVIPPPAAPVAVATPATQPAVGGNPAALASAKLAAPATSQPTVVAVARPTPTTRPVLTSRQQFDRAEKEYARISALPLDKQPLDGLRWRYKTLAADTSLPGSYRQTAASRLAALTLQIDAQAQLAATARQAAEAAAREQALTAEQQELAERAKQEAVTTYAAVGTLRVSSLQQSGPTLYRLTDPVSGRTVIYLRSSDPKYAALLNQFVGVRGSIMQDGNLSLRYIAPTDAEVIDQAKVGNGIGATVIPPSLMAKGTASVGG